MKCGIFNEQKETEDLKMAESIVVYTDPHTHARSWTPCKTDKAAWTLHDILKPLGYNPVIHFTMNGMTDDGATSLADK